MSIARTAREIYLATKDDAPTVALVRAERTQLALDLALDGEKGKEITSATVNGQTFSAQVTITRKDRLTLLSQVVAMYDAGETARDSTIPFW